MDIGWETTQAAGGHQSYPAGADDGPLAGRLQSRSDADDRYPEPMQPGDRTTPVAGRERLSVVLATFQGDRFLAEQLETLRRQTRLPDELVVVDDASADATVEAVRRFARTAPFPVELVAREEHRGTGATFEEGLRRASGDIVFICDQDDRWRPEKVAVMAERMGQHPEALLAISDAVLIDAVGNRLSRSRLRVAGLGSRQRAALADDPLGQFLARQVVSGCTAALRAELVPAVVPFPVGLHPALGDVMYDRWISLVAAAAGPVLCVPERLVEYRIHRGQQVGIPALPARRMLPQTALRAAQFVATREERVGRSQYHRAHLEEIRKRLEVAGLDTGDSELRLRMADEHLRVREQVASSRRRAVLAARHAVDEDGYGRFALGWATAAADWLR